MIYIQAIGIRYLLIQKNLDKKLWQSHRISCYI